jgi:predicted dehydrogenase
MLQCIYRQAAANQSAYLTYLISAKGSTMATLLLQSTPPMPNSPAPIVILGAGGIVNDAHLPAYRKAGFPVAGIYDLDPAKAQRTAQTYAIPTVYASLDEAVRHAPANAVFDIAVPAAAILAILPHLPDGAGVLIQKPMGDDLDSARAIRDLCAAKRLKAAVNFQLRYAPFVLAARSLLDQGAIGDLHDMEVRVTVYTPWRLWKFMEQVRFAEITYHSIHYLDLMRACLGEPRAVYAKTVNHPTLPRLHGTRTTFILDYGEWLRATITANHHHAYGLKHQESYIKWEGSQGAIKAKMGLLLNYPEGVPDEFEYCLLGETDEPTWQNVPIAGSWFPDAFIGTMASVMRYVEGSAAAMPTAVEDALRTMALVDAACRSSESGATPILFEGRIR